MISPNAPLYSALLVVGVLLVSATAILVTLNAMQESGPQNGGLVLNETANAGNASLLPDALLVSQNGSGFCSGAKQDFACPSACPLSADVDCCRQSNGCWIKEIGCVKQGTQNGECLSCVSSSFFDEWTPAVYGVSCSSDSNSCTVDACDGSGSCGHTAIEDGASCESGACCGGACVQVPKCSQCQEGPFCENGAWVCKNRVEGFSCASAGGICSAGECDGKGNCLEAVISSYCLIGGKCFQGGQVNPLNQCQKCAPEAIQISWLNLPDQTACSSDENECTQDSCKNGLCSHQAVQKGVKCKDDGLNCTADSCTANGACGHEVVKGFCAIEGACVVDGSENPQNPCLYCNASLNPLNWSAKKDFQACGEKSECGQNICLKGKCTWDKSLEGKPCTKDNYSCTQDLCLQGECTHDVLPSYCVIGELCVKENLKSLSNECLACKPAYSPHDWKALEGTKCTDDANECTKDLCSAQGTCEHENKEKGTPCSSDEDPCSDDSCDGQGSCIHSKKPVGGLCSRESFCTDTMMCTGKACDEKGECTKPGGTCQVCNQTSHSLCATTSCKGVVFHCTNVGGTWKWTSKTICDDGDSCTKGDYCSNKKCVGKEFNPLSTCNEYLLVECPASTSKNSTQIIVRHFQEKKPSCEGVQLSAIYAETGANASFNSTCREGAIAVDLVVSVPGKYFFNASDIETGFERSCLVKRFGEVPLQEFPDFNLLLLPLIAFLAIAFARKNQAK